MTKGYSGHNKTLFLTQFSILLAIEALVCFTPLGSLPAFGPIVMTLGMIPVIVTAILLGTGAGSAMGFFAGLFSFIVWTFMPPNPLTAFVFTPFYSVGELSGNFWSVVICFVPRILVGTVTGLCYSFFSFMFEQKGKMLPMAYMLSGFLGSMANTLLVMAGIFFCFGQPYAEAVGQAYNALLGLIGLTILTNGVPEAILGAIAAYAVCRPIQKTLR